MSVLEKASKMSVSTQSDFRPRYTPTRSARQAVAAKGINYARRRAMVAVLFVVAVLAVAFSVLQTQSAGATAHSGKASFTYVYVAPGDTLWSIATKYAPDADPQQEIIDIQNLNSISGSELVPGQRLALP
mgnify:CR=1 FL=1